MKNAITVGASTIPGEVILPHLLPKILQRNHDIAVKLIVNNSQTTFDLVRMGEIEVGTHYDSDEVDYQTVIQDDRLVLIVPNTSCRRQFNGSESSFLGKMARLESGHFTLFAHPACR